MPPNMSKMYTALEQVLRHVRDDEFKRQTVELDVLRKKVAMLQSMNEELRELRDEVLCFLMSRGYVEVFEDDNDNELSVPASFFNVLLRKFNVLRDMLRKVKEPTEDPDETEEEEEEEE